MTKPSANLNDIYRDLVRQILRKNLEKLTINKIEAKTPLTVELIHDMRVAIRRLRAAMKTFKKILPNKTKKLRKKLQKLGHLLGKKRDFDVFSECIHHAVNDKSISFQKLARQSDQFQKRILLILQSKDYAQLMKSIKCLKILTIKQNALKVSKNRIEKALLKVLKIAPSIDSKVNDRILHKLRLSIKKLRYVCEFFEPILHNSTLGPLIEKTKNIQDILGNHQDAITGISLLMCYKSAFSKEKFLQIKKKYQQKKLKTRKTFSNIWKNYLILILNQTEDENENQIKRFHHSARRKYQITEAADDREAFLRFETGLSKNHSRTH